jgi:hypothetical protein
MEIDSQQYFYLMHKNERVVVLQIDTHTGTINNIGKKINPELLPVGGNLSKQSLIDWWNRRAIPKTRSGIEAALKILNMESVNSLLVSNLGLSLTDQYWINPVDNELDWDKINLYDNDFCDLIGDFFFSKNEEELDIKGKTVFLPSASLQGVLQKKWIIDDNGKRCLVKGNYGASCQQSLNEVFATEIHKKQNTMPYTEYSLISLTAEEDTGVGCISESFTSKDREFISAYDLCNSEKKLNDMSEYEFFIYLCSRNGLDSEYVRRFLDYQILSDFVITNRDRHFKNFGVLRDPDTLEFLDVAPIFDSGNAMFWDVATIPKSFNFYDIDVISFKKKEIKLLEYITNKNVFDLSKLPEDDFIKNLYIKDSNMSSERIEAIISAYKKKQEIVEMLQYGANRGSL